jgi:flagellar biosynthesis protein FlhG
MHNPNKTLSLSVLSGKGGVGKTNLALNMAYALFRAGQKSLLMDCDLGLANLDVLLGLSPESNLQDILRSGVRARDVVVAIEEGGLDLLPAASGVPELVEMDEDMQEMLFNKLVELFSRYHYLILDLGAGINNTVLSFASMTQLRLVMLTSEPTSLTDSYALIKVLSSQHAVEDFHVVVNEAESHAEGKQTFTRLSAACEKFLGIRLKFLGAVRQDPHLPEAVRRQKPLLKHAPKCNASQDILSLAAKIQKYRMDNMATLAGTPVMRQFPDLEANEKT